MECKIGEIRQINGKWLQCIEGNCNKECYFYNRSLHKTISGINGNDFGACNACFRNDNKSVVFKELKKIGESYDDCGTTLQRFKIYTNVTNADTKGLELHIYSNDTIGIEIKQSKEDTSASDRTINECLLDNGKLNLKPFDIQKAKEGKPVCTRDGRKARIICFDLKNDEYPIVAAVEDDSFEVLFSYTTNGEIIDGIESDKDLMMFPEKKEGWINIYNADTTFYYADGLIFKTKDEAVQKAKEEVEKEQREKNEYIDTIRVEWEE